MKILSLNLKAFGPFTEQTLEIGDHSAGLTVVYGPNEAGKSSALRAVHDMLFGIPVKTPDNFRHQYKHIRVGGSLQNGSDGRFDFLRRKGNSDTLRGADDTKTLDEVDLARLLGGCSSELFRSMFGISHETLRKGGREIAAGQGDVGELLFIAGGASDLRQVQQSITEQAKVYWSPKKGLVREQLASLTSARRELKKSSLSVNDWKDQAAVLEKAQAEEQELSRQIEELDRALVQRQRYKTALASIPQWRENNAKLKEVATAPRLSSDFTQRRLATEKALSLAQGQLDDASVAITQIESRLAGLVVSENLLNAAGQVESLNQRLAQYRKALQDRPKLELELRSAKGAADEILKNLGRTDGWIDLDQLRIPATLRKRIQEFAKSSPRITIRLQNAAKDLQRAKKDVEGLQKKLASLPTQGDAQGLKLALTRHLDVISTSELTRRQRDITQRQQQCEIQLSQLRGWSGLLDELERLAVPPTVAIDRQEKAERDLEAALAAIQQAASQCRQRAKELTLELTTLERGVAIPTEDALLEIRAARETVWHELQKQFLSSTNEVDQSLVAAFQEAVNEADRLADRMRREADRVAKKAIVQAERQAIEAELANLTQQEQKVLIQRTDLANAWRSSWSAIGVTTESAAEMRGWRQQYDELMKLAGDLRRATEELTHETSRYTVATTEIRAALSTVDGAGVAENATLEQLKAVVQSRIESIQEQSNRIRVATDALETAQRQQHDAESELKSAENELREWQAGWAAQMSSLKRSDETLPDDAIEELDQLKAFFAHVKETEALQERLSQITDSVSRFEQDVTSVLVTVNQSLNGRAFDAVVLDLRTEISQVQLANEQQKSDQSRLDELRTQKQLAEARRNEALKQQELLRAETGCQTVTEIPRLEQAAEQRRTLEQQIAALELSLRELSGGKPIPEFEEEISRQDVDELLSQVHLDEQRLKELRSKRDEVLQTIRQEHLTLEKMTGGDLAARQAEECEFVSAELAENVRKLAVLRLSEAILRNGIEHHRQHNQGPILARARTLFAELTCGAMADLVADIEGGKHVVYGVRAGTQERLEVESMSEGTQDQLFLALRLASVEHWLERNEAIPFIVDDVLLTFDDLRAAAALKVLARLSEKTQVIFFTHHQHLVDLAKEHIPEKKLHVRSLVPAL